jgi:hypothetical protein
MITDPVPVPSQDTPKPRRPRQSARPLSLLFNLSACGFLVLAVVRLAVLPTSWRSGRQVATSQITLRPRNA